MVQEPGHSMNGQEHPHPATEQPTDYRPYQVPREALLAAVEASVMVVAPDCTLVVRVPGWLTREQVRAYQHQIDELLRRHRVNNHVLIMAGEEFAVMSNLLREAREAPADQPKPEPATEELRYVESTGPHPAMGGQTEVLPVTEEP